MTPKTDEEVIHFFKQTLDFETGCLAVQLYELYRAQPEWLAVSQAYEKVLLALIARPIIQERKL